MAEIDDMSYREFAGWQEFYGIEPFGLAVDDAMQAHQASVLANVNRDPKARPEPYRLREFLLYQDPEPEATASPEEPRVDGLTAQQWKVLHFFRSLKKVREREKAEGQGPH